ncbi:MAG: hypothetical protein AB7P21_14305 [Lautropia sp.]
MLRAHALLGAIGAAVGVLLFGALYGSGAAAIAATPVGAFVAIVFVCTMLGLLLAGLLGLRPDHGVAATKLRRRLRAGRWVVVAHPEDGGQARVAEAVMLETARELVRTL